MMDDFHDETDDLLLLAAIDESVNESLSGTGSELIHLESVSTVPEVFPFPFIPYDIQKEFMKNLYVCLEKGNIGIFESPTGTGKSLSLICGALKWLQDYQKQQRKELEAFQVPNVSENYIVSRKENKELDWISEFAAKKEKEEKLQKIKEEQENIQKREAKLKELQQSNPLVQKRKRKFKLEEDFDDILSGASVDIKKACQKELDAISAETDDKFGVNDEELVLNDYYSDDDCNEGRLEKVEKEEEEDQHVTKIYYCSRTHSQLTQFVREIVKGPYEDTRVISLGSRQNMCINPAVRKLRSLTLMNDRCLELQQKKSKKKPGCPFQKQELLQVYKDKALLDIMDIEQLVSLGKQQKSCPYYGARYAVPSAEIVALPYNTLLHKPTREAYGIKLAGNVVIVDEAHNLLETINNIHSVEITGAQIVKAHSQLSHYESKFQSRLKAKNLMYVRQILFVLSHLAAVLGDVSLVTINNFLFQGQFDNLNMFKLLRYCQRSNISKKLHGFVEKYKDTEVKTESEKSKISGLTKFLQEIKTPKLKNPQCSRGAETEDMTANTGFMSSPLMQIESFLEALTTADQDGRVVVNRQVKVGDSSLKFLLLNPAVHFVDVLNEARAVVVAGGTMQPVSEFKDQLFHAAGISSTRITEFSCGHVIPGHQLFPMAIAKGPTNLTFDFTYQSRDKPAVIEELGRTVINIVSVVPGGVVCFFPSYDYENLVYSTWEKGSVLQTIQTKKKVYREPKRSGLADQVLTEFSDCIKRCASWQGTVTGALLLCVVGGKMSEGINFSDDLGRCVIMVGLPYPNMYSPELKEKMNYLNATFAKDKEGRQPGQVHYENLCMKAVNQSIGRAIRHKDDYASIILLDHRYLRTSISSKLPTWISKHLQKSENFSGLIQGLRKFFNTHSHNK